MPTGTLSGALLAAASAGGIVANYISYRRGRAHPP